MTTMSPVPLIAALPSVDCALHWNVESKLVIVALKPPVVATTFPITGVSAASSAFPEA